MTDIDFTLFSPESKVDSLASALTEEVHIPDFSDRIDRDDVVDEVFDVVAESLEISNPYDFDDPSQYYDLAFASGAALVEGLHLANRIRQGQEAAQRLVDQAANIKGGPMALLMTIEALRNMSAGDSRG